MKETETIKNRVLSELEDAFSIYISEDRPELKGSDFRIRLEYSRNEKFGDYSSSAALENKNLLGNPVHAAEAIVKRLKNRSFFSDVNFTPPGFINFRISETALSEYLKGILQNEDFRFPKTGNPEKI
ncbi:MAG TPA: arginine--tRNA ligase, partial [Leptospiraceae bacterium]|nr:arginine--tRNA ligase [Leptospiraceae bacterium]